jgi:ComF family protein
MFEYINLAYQKLKFLALCFIKLIFPPQCLNCNILLTEIGLCSDCWQRINFYDGNGCTICSMPIQIKDSEINICGKCLITPPNYSRSSYVFQYDDNSHKLIYQFKYHDKLYCTKYLSAWMSRVGQELIQQADMIIPIPLHKYRLITRKYNQSALLARSIAEINKKPYFPSIVGRVKNNKQQTALTRKQRKKNVKGIFKIRPGKSHFIKGKIILLIDDVITTGATIEECAKELIKGGCKAVYILTLAKKV